LNIVSCASVEQINDITVCNRNDISADGHHVVRDECEQVDDNCDVHDIDDATKLKHDYIDVETVNQSMCDSGKANVESLIYEQLK